MKSRPKQHSGKRTLQLEELETRRLLALNPTADEQEYMQLVNRFRTDPRGEFTRMFSSASPLTARDSILQTDIDFAGVSGPTLQAELNSLSPVPPVAWNEAIRDFAVSHTAKLVAQRQQFHSNTLQRREALINAGVNLRFAAGEKINSENVFGFGRSVFHAYAAFMVDWQRGGPGGMAASRSHRVALHNDDFEQAGHAISNVGGTGFGPKVITQVLANIENPPVMVTGAIFQDQNASGWYEAGEGIGGVQFVFEGAAGRFTTTGYSTGGYQIELPPGTYTATATGGGMRYPQRMSNIVVGSENLWKNWLYDPNAIPPDALESNDTYASATPLTGAPQSFSGLTINHTNDHDYFRLTVPGNGRLDIQANFSHAAGNVEMELLNSAGARMLTSFSTTDNESISVNVGRESTFFIHVFGRGATNGNYSLTVSPPQAAPPVASADRANLIGTTATTINVIANDDDPDGPNGSLVPRLAANSPSHFSVVAGNRIRYDKPDGFFGIHRTTYTVEDDQGLSSAPAEIAVFSVDFSDATPWQHNANPMDVNSDGVESPIDALLIVNELNQRQSRRLPTDASGGSPIFGYVDTSGDGFVSPLDALLIINSLNNAGAGEGEPAKRSTNGDTTVLKTMLNDQVFADFSAADIYWPWTPEWHKRRTIG